jgi:hypothetical protein
MNKNLRINLNKLKKNFIKPNFDEINLFYLNIQI